MNDASKQRILTVSVDNATISAYNHEGKLIGQSSVPDSIKSKFRTIDQIPRSKYKDWRFHEVSKTFMGHISDQYYGVNGIVRLNDRYIGLKIGKADKDIYLVFDNDLIFKGYFEEPSELTDLVYADGDKTVFISKYDNKVRTVQVR